jgi:hypothetical protein
MNKVVLMRPVKIQRSLLGYEAHNVFSHPSTQMVNNNYKKIAVKL